MSRVLGMWPRPCFPGSLLGSGWTWAVGLVPKSALYPDFEVGMEGQFKADPGPLPLLEISWDGGRRHLSTLSPCFIAS